MVMNNIEIQKLAGKAKNIKLVLTDNDGVLTDTGVYYSEKGEELKKYSVRDGMGVERLRKILKLETGIITRERSDLIRKRARKLKIKKLYTGAKKKELILEEILKEQGLNKENIAYIGDDENDIEVLKSVGLSAAPADAMKNIKNIVNYVCENSGGGGAFREFAELLIELKKIK